jgi:hypothetical protein
MSLAPMPEAAEPAQAGPEILDLGLDRPKIALEKPCVPL